MVNDNSASCAPSKAGNRKTLFVFLDSSRDLRRLSAEGERCTLPHLLRCTSPCGQPRLRTLRAAGRLRDVRMRGVQERRLRFRERQGALEVRWRRQEDSPRSEVPRLQTGGRAARRATDAAGPRQHQLRRRRARTATPFAPEEEGLQSGRTTRQGRGREDESNRIGYTRSRAQHKGPSRTLGGPEKGQRRRRLLSHRMSARQDPTRRRRLYYRSNNERMRSLTRSGRRPRSPRPEPVQDMLALQHGGSAGWPGLAYQKTDKLKCSRRPKGGAPWTYSLRAATSR